MAAATMDRVAGRLLEARVLELAVATRCAMKGNAEVFDGESGWLCCFGIDPFELQRFAVSQSSKIL